MTLAKQSAHRRVLAAALRWGKACDEIKVVVQAAQAAAPADEVEATAIHSTIGAHIAKNP